MLLYRTNIEATYKCVWLMVTLASYIGRRLDFFATDSQLNAAQLAGGWHEEFSEPDQAVYYFSSHRARSQWMKPRDCGVYADSMAAYVGATQNAAGAFARAPALAPDTVNALRLLSPRIDSLVVLGDESAPPPTPDDDCALDEELIGVSTAASSPSSLAALDELPASWSEAGVARLLYLLSFVLPHSVAHIVSPPPVDPTHRPIVTHPRKEALTVDPRHANAAAAVALLDTVRRMTELRKPLLPRHLTLGATVHDVPASSIVSWIVVLLLLFAGALYQAPRSKIEKISADGMCSRCCA